MKTLFDYRLVENYYRNRIEWEDGPGSLRNIVSDMRTRVVRTWARQSEDFEHRLTTIGLHGLQQNSADGWHEYLYQLERRSSADEEWKFVGFVTPQPDFDPDTATDDDY